MRSIKIFYKTLFVFGAFAIPVSNTLQAQCPLVQFQMPEIACLNETLQISNTSSDISAEFTWDFCGGDLFNNPSAQPLKQILAASAPMGLDLADVAGNHFLFVTGRTSNNIVRLDFGPDPLNPNPDVVNLGNPGGMLKGPVGIKLVKEGDLWYGLVYNSVSDSLLRIDFGSSITNVNPTPHNVAKAYASGNNNSGLSVGVSKSQTVVVVTNPSTNKINLFDFGSSITNVPADPSDILSTAAITGASSLRGISLTQICNNWYGFAVAFSSRKIYRLDFGSDLFSIPAVVDITGSFSGTENFQDIQVQYDAGTYIGFILTSQGIVYRLDFGADISAIPTAQSLGNLGVISSAARLAFLKHGSIWNFFSFNTGTRFLYRADFPNKCSAMFETHSGFDPTANAYALPGTYPVTLELKSLEEGVNYLTQQVVVEDKRAPELDLFHAGLCVGHDVQFFISSDMVITDLAWQFGDGGVATGQNPIHQYISEGEFPVQVSVLAQNGCRNMTADSLKLYPAPEAAFLNPSGILCTNNVFTFPATTPDTYDGYLSYQWFVDNAAVTADRDLQVAFTSTGAKDIRLITSIPGCSSEITKTTSPVEEGPVVDFSYTGVCEDETFSFQSLVAEPVEGYLWDFGNSQTATSPNPDQVFSTSGDYAVSLTATNAIGCQNKETKVVAVHGKPAVGFMAEGPPNTCSGTPVLFVNQSTAPAGEEIAGWLWDFHDPKATGTDDRQDPEHVFADAGSYTVSLSATTNFGCADIFQNDISIYLSPSTVYLATPACDDVAVNFTAAGTEIDEWYWEIGTSYYTTATPVHTFRSAGDYPLFLEVTGANGCVSSVRTVIQVPEPLTPDFTSVKNCVGQEAILTDITTGADAVVSREWTLGTGETFTGSPFKHVFGAGGNESVTLKVTGESGCNYLVTKTVEVLPPPVAGFSADPSSGAYPLDVLFTNTSSNATQYRWKFNDNDNDSSYEETPLYTFTGPGIYDVELTAFNQAGCEDTFSGSITTVAPLPDADIELITLASNPDGSMKLIVTIHNKGNTVIKDLPVVIDFDGTVKLQQVVGEAIPPSSMHNYVLSSGIADLGTVGYLCASIDVPGDLHPEGNRMCREVDDALFVFPAFPNPTSGLLTLEWIAAAKGDIHVSVTDVLGRRILNLLSASAAGLNNRALDLSGLENGIYYLIVDDGNGKKSQRIVVSGKP